MRAQWVQVEGLEGVVGLVAGPQPVGMVPPLQVALLYRPPKLQSTLTPSPPCFTLPPTASDGTR
jgi:hypothetical protein